MQSDLIVKLITKKKKNKNKFTELMETDSEKERKQK